MSETENEMLNTTQAAAELGISVPTFRRLLASGKIPKPEPNPLLQRPRRLYFSRAELKAAKERLKAPDAPRDGQGEG